MKIKRFEASSMSDALRAVKKDFGDDAVILSAKTVKKSNRIFGGKRKSQVVVTAAIDREAASGIAGAGAAKPSSELADTSFDAISKSGFAPITKTGQKKLKSKFVRFASEIQRQEPSPMSCGNTLHKCLRDQGLEDEIIDDWSRQVRHLISDSEENRDGDEERFALSQVINASHLADPGTLSGHSTGSGKRQRRIVLVGPSGSGKTTMAAKLAASAGMQSQSVAVLSLDHLRVAGTEELVRYARIIGFQFAAPSGAEEINNALDHCRDDDVIVVDTPGVDIRDTETLTHVSRMISQIENAEIHLLLNAGFQLFVMKTILDFFKPLGVARLVFTHLDWVKYNGHLFNMAIHAGLPVSYLADTSEVPDGFQPATAERMVNLLMPAATPTDEKGLEKNAPVTVIRSPNGISFSKDRFLANRNSDIFHRPDCRSVQRINDNNILVFENEMDAKAQSYKPCRMCCHDLLIPKPINAMGFRTTARGRYN
jgi:flagellar biosynthesis GTPase FlhF